MKKNLPIPKNQQKGFTLLETLVAIFILSLSITGPVYIASVAFRNTIDSRDNISAQYIAEEVVEVIRNKRDQYVLGYSDPKSWLVSITPTNECTSPKKCIMERDFTTGAYTFTECPVNSCPNISFDPDGLVGPDEAVYGKTGVATRSKFIRELYFETYGGNIGEVMLVVNILWQDKGRIKKYTLTERLYSMNYREYFKP